MLETVTLTTFAPLLHTTFRVYPTEAQVIELELIEAADRGSSAHQERFSLLFRGPLDSFLPQQTYQVEHEQLGGLHLFLVPVAQGIEKPPLKRTTLQRGFYCEELCLSTATIYAIILTYVSTAGRQPCS